MVADHRACLQLECGLGLSWTAKRIKAIRFSLIALPGRIIDHARQLVITLVQGHPSSLLLIEARQRIMRLVLSGQHMNDLTGNGKRKQHCVRRGAHKNRLRRPPRHATINERERMKHF
jgi:hypothetical protein